MRGKIAAWLAWAWFGVFVTAVLWGMARSNNYATDDIWTTLEIVLWSLFVIVFSFVGALIVSRQPRNTVGWLLMIPPLGFALNGLLGNYLSGLETIPAEPSTLFLVAAWLNNVLFLPLIFSALFILQLFPTGRVVSPRWRWFIALGLSLSIIFLVMAAFETEFLLGDTRTVPNPIGFWSPGPLFTAIGSAGFVLFIVGSAASLFSRYRRAGQVERKQIKWLLYACSLFVVAFILNIGLGDSPPTSLLVNISTLSFVVTFAAIPVAIAIAILRYNLWDINVIIRKTVIYTVLSVLLAMVYFGVIILLQNIVEVVSGQQSAISIVISTLIIAALFSPLRQRVQAVIDRRFFRKKYDAQQVLAQFAQTARDEVSMEALTTELTHAVQETMQPEQVSLWFKQPDNTQFTD
jgi:hypothetical protein